VAWHHYEDQRLCLILEVGVNKKYDEASKAQQLLAEAWFDVVLELRESLAVTLIEHAASIPNRKQVKRSQRQSNSELERC